MYQFYAHFSFLFRDNGITVQLMKYQLYTEIFVFLLNFFLVFLPSERDILMIKIIGILNTFMTFVIYPLFYLSGDVNFRNRILRKGLWLAIKTELFSSTSVDPLQAVEPGLQLPGSQTRTILMVQTLPTKLKLHQIVHSSIKSNESLQIDLN